MINTIFSSLNNAITTLWGYLVRIDNQVPVLKIALGLFLVIQLSRFFIMPMFKGLFVKGSDSVKEEKVKK